MIGTLVTNLLTPLSLLSPVETLAAVAAVTYAVGGLVALRIAQNRPRTPSVSAAKPHPIDPPFKAAA